MGLIPPPVDSWDVEKSTDVHFTLIELKFSELLIYFERFAAEIEETTFIPAP